MPVIPVATTALAYSATPSRFRAALVDSGSTRTASGDPRPFPTDRIKQRNPNMRVKVANGVTLPV
eukprot:4399146-Pleurochrysis_carterae.AAC.1